MGSSAHLVYKVCPFVVVKVKGIGAGHWMQYVHVYEEGPCSTTARCTKKERPSLFHCADAFVRATPELLITEMSEMSMRMSRSLPKAQVGSQMRPHPCLANEDKEFLTVLSQVRFLPSSGKYCV